MRYDCNISVQSFHDALDPQLVGIPNKDDAQRESHCCTSSHCQFDFEDSQDGHEISTKLKFEGHLHFVAAAGPQGNLMKTKFGQL